MSVRELSVNERMTWGECPVCHAKDKEPCNSHIGIALGTTASGSRPTEGAHLARLRNAPMRIREVPMP